MLCVDEIKNKNNKDKNNEIMKNKKATHVEPVQRSQAAVPFFLTAVSALEQLYKPLEVQTFSCTLTIEVCVQGKRSV